MKKLLLMLMMGCATLQAQDKILLSLTPGYSVYNSENGMFVVGDYPLRWLAGVSAAYESENFYGYPVHMEYNLTYWMINGASHLPNANETGPLPGDMKVNYSIAINNADLNIRRELSPNVDYEIGPTVALVARSLTVREFDFTDRLVTLDVGANAALTLRAPFSDAENGAFFFTSMKLRYLHSVWTDARGRNIDGYFQKFLYGQIHLGIGWGL